MKEFQTICPGLYMLPSETGGRFPQSNSFFIEGSSRVLIDAGCGMDLLRRVRDEWEPGCVLISHSHVDHCAGLWLFHGIDILSPKEHKEIFWRLSPMATRFMGENGPPALIKEWKDFVTSELGVRDAAPGRHFQDGDVLDFGCIKLNAIHTPGHLDDHYVFFEQTHGVALTFDIDLTPFGPWYGNPESDIDAFLASIQKVIELKPAKVATSHMGILTEDIEERLLAYARIVDKRDERILTLLQTPRPLNELVDHAPVYGGFPYREEVLRFFEGVMIEKHLERMGKNGRVHFEDGLWCQT